uniref:Uncharacterized protein n=1 Tax=Tetraselmis sp. GSL018 TaxID=582737 RepID=A0A061S3W7_9CHLO
MVSKQCLLYSKGFQCRVSFYTLKNSVMCRRVQCEQCMKPTWAGCGMHIEQALAGVKPEDRCKCPRGGNRRLEEPEFVVHN